MNERFKFRAWDGERLRSVNTIGWTNGELDWLDTPKYHGPIDEDIKLMQFTGIKDKNGVEIYEGDIIASQNSDRDNWYVSHHEVVWHDSGLQAKQICSNGSHIGLSYWTRGENGYVVIGNIYENPDLLEATK